MTDFQSLVETKLEPVGLTSKDVIYRCPKCEGTTGSGHFYIDYNKGYYHCFKCDFAGKRMEGLLKFLHIDISYDYGKLYSDRDKDLDDIICIRKSSKEDERVLEYSKDLITLTEYYNLHSRKLSPVAIQYLKNRGLSETIIDSLAIREGLNRYGERFNIRGTEYVGRDYSGRILVPSMKKEGLISFYVGRDYLGDKDAKYINCSSDLGIASEDVWNLDYVDADSVIICEGVFTAIAVNQALRKNIAVATYGKSISQKSSAEFTRVTSQGEKLLNRGFSSYIVFYDKDAIESSVATCDYLYNRGCNVNLVVIPPNLYGPKADAADMTREEIINCIRGSLRYDSLSRLFI